MTTVNMESCISKYKWIIKNGTLKSKNSTKSWQNTQINTKNSQWENRLSSSSITSASYFLPFLLHHAGSHQKFWFSSSRWLFSVCSRDFSEGQSFTLSPHVASLKSFNSYSTDTIEVIRIWLFVVVLSLSLSLRSSAFVRCSFFFERSVWSVIGSVIHSFSPQVSGFKADLDDWLSSVYCICPY